jgi:NADH-quinone oxidoreductase subunit N
MTGADFAILIPEIVLSLFAMAALMGAVYTSKDGLAPALTTGTALVFVVMALYIGIGADGTRVAFGGMFVDDAFARFAKITILLSAAAVLLIGRDYMEKADILRFEYPVLVTLAVIGMMVMVSAGDLIALYMGLELQSLALYVIASLRRDSVRSTEAGLKYFILGALSSGLLLYGASLTYGYAGTTLFSGIIETATAGEMPLGLLFGLVFVMAGLAFKVSAAPFHMWTPDVYEGAPTPITPPFSPPPPRSRRWRCLRGSFMMHSALLWAIGNRSWPFWPCSRCLWAPLPRSARPISSG